MWATADALLYHCQPMLLESLGAAEGTRRRRRAYQNVGEHTVMPVESWTVIEILLPHNDIQPERLRHLNYIFNGISKI